MSCETDILVYSCKQCSVVSCASPFGAIMCLHQYDCQHVAVLRCRYMMN